MRLLSRNYALLCILAPVALGACASVKIEGDPSFRRSGADTYAWTASATEELSPPDESRIPWREFQQEIDAELTRRGMRAVAPGDADFLVQANLSVELKVRENHPYFEAYVAEKYEEGSLSVKLLQRESRDLLWGGEKRLRLRLLARARGSIILLQWVPVDGRRDWRLAESVGEIFARFPDKLDAKSSDGDEGLTVVPAADLQADTDRQANTDRQSN